MAISELCNREVIVAARSDSALEAARLMRTHHVGDVLVVDEREGKRIPVGIVTDRDLVMESIALEVDPREVSVGDIMISNMATVKENTGIFETVQYMRSKGVRRMPVVGQDGALVGIVTLDDLLVLLAEEMGALAKLISTEQQMEIDTRSQMYS